MSGRISLLGGLLALQLLAVGVLLFADVAGDGSRESTFLEGDPTSVSGLDVFDADGRSVRLVRGVDGWTVSSPADTEAPSLGPLPADSAKVAEVLEKLLGQRVQWPVGTTAETRERFEVTETAFQRKLVLESASGEEREVYLGTSPGYRRVHARRADADEVYSIDFANYQVPAELEDWVDKTLLAARGPISQVTREGAWTLTRGAEGWLVDGRAANTETAEDLVGRLEDLRIIGLVPADEGAAAQKDAAAVVLKVTDEEATYQLRLARQGESDEYHLLSDRLEGRFTVAAYVAEQLLLEAEDLAAAADESPAPAVADPGQ
jgi:hypothetical protein